MSAVTVWQGLEERFRTIVGLAVPPILGEPTAIHATPLLYAGYASADQIMRSVAPAHNIDGLTHIFAVRLVFDDQDNPMAEMQLLTLADSVPQAISTLMRARMVMMFGGASLMISSGSNSWISTRSLGST